MGWMSNMSEKERREWLKAGTIADRRWDEQKRQRQDPQETLSEELLYQQNKRTRL